MKRNGLNLAIVSAVLVLYISRVCKDGLIIYRRIAKSNANSVYLITKSFSLNQIGMFDCWSRSIIWSIFFHQLPSPRSLASASGEWRLPTVYRRLWSPSALTRELLWSKECDLNNCICICRWFRSVWSWPIDFTGKTTCFNRGIATIINRTCFDCWPCQHLHAPIKLALIICSSAIIRDPKSREARVPS